MGQDLPTFFLFGEAEGKILIHLSGVANYHPLDWRLVKAMLWIDSGANSKLWRTHPMQIGGYPDRGMYKLFLREKNATAELIFPPDWKGRLTPASVRQNPIHNICAAVAYLLMQMVQSEIRSVPDEKDARIYEIVATERSTLETIARRQGSTLAEMERLNLSAEVRAGQRVKYRKATMKRAVNGWRTISYASVAERYNAGADPYYEDKLNYAHNLVCKRK